MPASHGTPTLAALRQLRRELFEPVVAGLPELLGWINLMKKCFRSKILSGMNVSEMDVLVSLSRLTFV